MDDLTLLHSFRAEHADEDPRARAAAWSELEASFERASAAAASRPHRSSHRGIFALTSAVAFAAMLAGVLVFSSGPPAESAAAEILHKTAGVAAATGAPTPVPDLGQFLYRRTKSLELQEWAPGAYTASYGGAVRLNHDHKPPFSAFISWETEEWMSRDEPSRTRRVMGTPRFLTSSERSRWEKAGSPLPGPFNGKGEKRGFPESHTNELRRGVMDVETMSGHGFRDFSMLPREPKGLRLAIEHRQTSGSSVNTGRVIGELWDILDKPNGTPALRAAVYGALAELPGMELNRDAEDLVGRPGYAVSYESPDSGTWGGGQLPGLRVEYIFDPETSDLLGKREVVANPAKIPWAKGLPAGTPTREVAYLQSGIVGSTRERPGETQIGRQRASTSSDLNSGR